MNEDGLATLDAIIARLRSVEGSVADRVAKDAAPAVMKVVQATASAGTAPDGTPWPARNDGQRAIADAASAVDAVARGPVILIRVRRGAAIQHMLTGEHRRQVIPDAGKPIPAGIVDAIQRSFSKIIAGD